MDFDHPPMRYEFIPVSACEMCGSTQHKMMGLRLNRTQGYRPRQASGIAVSVKRCRECDLIFSDPRPKPANISDHYGIPAESYWTSAAEWETSEHYFAREISEAKRLLDFQPGMKALDIGAGLGNAMTAMQRAGFDVYGIEPSAPFRGKAIERMSIPEDRLRLASIEEAEFRESTFDFITFGAVLEHIQEPGRAIERAMRWLKPGGVMQAEVPSSHWLVNRIANAFFLVHGLNYVSNLSPMHSPFHLYEFGLESFRRHARRAGYQVAQHRVAVCEIYHLPKILHPLLRAYMRRTGTGMQLTVWLRRSPPGGQVS